MITSGFTDAYCGLGCVADCTTAALTTINMPWTTFVSRVASSTISDVTLAANSEPVLGSPTGISISVTRTSVAVLPTPTMTISSDGTCGIQSGGTVCGDWPLGSCCSMYGWCGNTYVPRHACKKPLTDTNKHWPLWKRLPVRSLCKRPDWHCCSWSKPWTDQR